MAGTLHMNVDEVRKMSTRLEETATILKQISEALQVAIEILDKTAFIGMFGGTVIAAFLKVMKPQIDNMAKKCTTTKQYVDQEVKEWLQAQQTG